MAKAYDSFVSKNPALFKMSTLDLFVKVGFLSPDVYNVAKAKLQEPGKKSTSNEGSSVSAPNSSASETHLDSLAQKSAEQDSASNKTEPSSETTTIV